jgi:hypothetical protein
MLHRRLRGLHQHLPADLGATTRMLPLAVARSYGRSPASDGDGFMAGTGQRCPVPAVRETGLVPHPGGESRVDWMWTGTHASDRAAAKKG